LGGGGAAPAAYQKTRREKYISSCPRSERSFAIRDEAAKQLKLKGREGMRERTGVAGAALGRFLVAADSYQRVQGE